MEEEGSKTKNMDYNYPPLNRVDLMSLSTIGSRDANMKPFKKLDTARDWSVNLYNLDIPGTCPRRIGSFNQKVDFINKNDDIERSSPKLLHVGLNKPEYNLTNKDIEYSSPGCVKIKTTRHLNPLEPKYNFCKCEPLPFEVPKFIRDNIQISDIDGAKPKKIMTKWATRESLKKDDIEKASPRQPYVRKTKYSSIDYRDVTHSEFKSGRMTNPLEPVYRLGYVTGEKVKVGPIDGNKPVVFSKYKYPDPYNLKTNDIFGTNVGSKNFISKFNGKNYGYTSLDILGAQSGTLKKGIVTERCLNPLVPKYQFIGGRELVGVETPKNNYTRISNTTIPGKKSERIKNIQIEDKKNIIEAPLSHSNSVSPNKVNNFKFNAQNTLDNNIVTNSPKNISPVQSPKNISPVQSPRQSHSLSPQHSPKVSSEIRRNSVNETIEGKPVIPPPDDTKLDLADMPYVEDVVKFDKSKYVRQKPFFGFLHDKYLIPPIEEHKKGEINTEINKSQAERETKALNTSYNPKKTNFNSSLPSFPSTYAQKLDQFMTKSNMQFINPNME
ncbi:MAG: hypothetical protein MJ252_26960 [archaeon]|nr:hypothetical protein [archaeon]